MLHILNREVSDATPSVRHELESICLFMTDTVRLNLRSLTIFKVSLTFVVSNITKYNCISLFARLRQGCLLMLLLQNLHIVALYRMYCFASHLLSRTLFFKVMSLIHRQSTTQLQYLLIHTRALLTEELQTSL